MRPHLTAALPRGRSWPNRPDFRLLCAGSAQPPHNPRRRDVVCNSEPLTARTKSVPTELLGARWDRGIDRDIVDSRADDVRAYDAGQTQHQAPEIAERGREFDDSR